MGRPLTGRGTTDMSVFNSLHLEITDQVQRAQLRAAGPIMDLIRVAFWTWFERNRDQVILKKRFLFLSVTLRVEDLEGVFRSIIGA